jgi:hypothetical protein
MKVYEKGRGDTSFRIETEYRLNEAGAKQYVLDQIKDLDSCGSNSLTTGALIDSRISGALFGLTALGLINIFDFEELKTTQSRSFNNFMQRLISPVEQI